MVCVPERIVLCVDACEDSDGSQSWDGSKGQPSSFELVKKCVEIFLHHKSLMNPEHEFALLIFKNASENMYAFSKDPKKIMSRLNEVKPERPCDKQPYLLSRIFNLALEKASKHPAADSSNQLPSLRFIILYSRPARCHFDSHGLTVTGFRNVVKDLLFIHRPFTSDADKEKHVVIFKELQKCLDERSFGYACYNIGDQALVDMARLLTHPGVRVSCK